MGIGFAFLAYGANGIESGAQTAAVSMWWLIIAYWFHTMGELLTTPVSKVLYISCDTQTLARDLKILVNGGYEIISSRPVDMFPQTHHCESITFLRYRP